MEQFKIVGITGRAERAHIEDTLVHLVLFLQQHGISVLLDQQIAVLLPNHHLPLYSRDELGQKCDLVIVVGGDGSMLSAARELVPHQVPVVGINRGRLGFLNDIHPDELELQLTDVLAGRYLIENRFLLEAFIRRDGELIGHDTALNDIVLHPGQSTRIIEFALFIDGQFVYQQRADGLIIATPTGSTAYALSGGGPIMHPRLNAMVLVPMHPHMLTNRPLVVSSDSELKLVICPKNTLSPQVSCDGQMHIAAEPGDEITIRKLNQSLQLLHPLNHNFYESCRSKLRWNSPQEYR